MRKTACPVVWEGHGAKSPRLDPIRSWVMGDRKLVALSGGDGSDVMVSLSNHDRAVDDVALRQAQGDREISLFILPLVFKKKCIF